jgi:hypothetical protein
VPTLGLRLRHFEDALSGDRGELAGAFVGVPWPPQWPWSAREGAVSFLQLELELVRRLSATDFRSDTKTARLTVSLSRELDLVARYTRTEPSALDLIRGIGERRTVEFACVYARGR